MGRRRCKVEILLENICPCYGVRSFRKGAGGQASSPSPTTSWYSGPVGCVKMLLVSIMGAACPLATARLYAAWEGYLGGGGRTLLKGTLSAICEHGRTCASGRYIQHGVFGRLPSADRLQEQALHVFDDQ